MTVRFEAPDVLFKLGSSDIQPKFKIILIDFFPRYIRILNSEKYREDIEEIKIEGHTSSDWERLPLEEVYFIILENPEEADSPDILMIRNGLTRSYKLLSRQTEEKH